MSCRLERLRCRKQRMSVRTLRRRCRKALPSLWTRRSLCRQWHPSRRNSQRIILAALSLRVRAKVLRGKRLTFHRVEHVLQVCETTCGGIATACCAKARTIATDVVYNTMDVVHNTTDDASIPSCRPCITSSTTNLGAEALPFVADNRAIETLNRRSRAPRRSAARARRLASRSAVR
jgi:hypothetical protein